MLIFFIYMTAISLGLALCAGVADLLGRLFPAWLETEEEE